MMSMLMLTLAILATYRITRLIVDDYGPGDVFIRLRNMLGVYQLRADGRPPGTIGRLLVCPHCVSIWVALPLAWWLATGDLGIMVLYWMAIAGGVSIVTEAVDSLAERKRW